MSRGPEGRSRQPSSAHASRQSPDATRWSDGQVIITALISRTECRFSHRWVLHVLWGETFCSRVRDHIFNNDHTL